jgi:hypothetical protein
VTFNDVLALGIIAAFILLMEHGGRLVDLLADWLARRNGVEKEDEE